MKVQKKFTSVMDFLLLLSHLLVAGCDIGKPCMKHLPDLLTLRHGRPLFRSSVRSFVLLSTFISKFDIYVIVSILINYKTK